MRWLSEALKIARSGKAVLTIRRIIRERYRINFSNQILAKHNHELQSKIISLEKEIVTNETKVHSMNDLILSARKEISELNFLVSYGIKPKNWFVNGVKGDFKTFLTKIPRILIYAGLSAIVVYFFNIRKKKIEELEGFCLSADAFTKECDDYWIQSKLLEPTESIPDYFTPKNQAILTDVKQYLTKLEQKTLEFIKRIEDIEKEINFLPHNLLKTKVKRNLELLKIYLAFAIKLTDARIHHQEDYPKSVNDAIKEVNEIIQKIEIDKETVNDPKRKKLLITAYNQRGLSQRIIGKYSDALESFNCILGPLSAEHQKVPLFQPNPIQATNALDPTNYVVLLNRASLLSFEVEKNEHALYLTQAVKDLELANRAMPNNAKIRCEQAYCYYKQGKMLPKGDKKIELYMRAEDLYNESLLFNSEDPNTWLQRGVLKKHMWRVGKAKLEDALNDFDRAILIDPFFTKAHQFRARTLAELCRFDKANEAVKKWKFNNKNSEKMQRVSDYIQRVRKASYKIPSMGLFWCACSSNLDEERWFTRKNDSWESLQDPKPSSMVQTPTPK